MGKELSDELIKRIEKEIRYRVIEKETTFRDEEKLSQRKEIIVDSLLYLTELPRDEIEKISKEIYEKYGYTNLDEVIELKKQIVQLEKTKALIETLAQKIPGFKSYSESADMHDADKAIRNYMYEKLVDFKKAIVVIMNTAQKRSDYKILPELDSLNLGLERTAKKCRYADYGSTINPAGKNIGGSDQNKILEYDWSLIAELDGIAINIKSLKKQESEDPTEIINTIKRKINTFEDSFEKRISVITEVL